MNIFTSKCPFIWLNNGLLKSCLKQRHVAVLFKGGKKYGAHPQAENAMMEKDYIPEY